MGNAVTEEFISRTEALKDFDSCNAENPNWTPQRVKTLLLRQPAADVAEVVHGKWIPCDNGGYYCSNCDTRIAFRLGEYFCNSCGAMMDGGKDRAVS